MQNVNLKNSVERQKELMERNVFSLRQKVESDEELRTCVGRLFQARGPATENRKTIATVIAKDINCM
jgi:hypothetical protein